MIEWKKVSAGDYVGLLDGRRVARVRRSPAGEWSISYRSPSMGTAKAAPPTRLLADAKKAAAALLLPGEPTA